MRKVSLGAFAAFRNTLRRELAAAGIAPEKHAELGMDEEYTVVTRTAGVYTCHVPTPLGSEPFLTVFGRFHEPQRAKQFVACNPWTGKWNFHGGYRTIEQAKVYAKDVVTTILSVRNRQPPAAMESPLELLSTEQVFQERATGAQLQARTFPPSPPRGGWPGTEVPIREWSLLLPGKDWPDDQRGAPRPLRPPEITRYETMLGEWKTIQVIQHETLGWVATP